MRLLFSSKANRDAAAKARKLAGQKVVKSNIRNQTINPKYVRDSGQFGIPTAFGDDLESYGALYILTYFDEQAQGWVP